MKVQYFSFISQECVGCMTCILTLHDSNVFCGFWHIANVMVHPTAVSVFSKLLIFFFFKYPEKQNKQKKKPTYLVGLYHSLSVKQLWLCKVLDFLGLKLVLCCFPWHNKIHLFQQRGIDLLWRKVCLQINVDSQIFRCLKKLVYNNLTNWVIQSFSTTFIKLCISMKWKFSLYSKHIRIYVLVFSYKWSISWACWGSLNVDKGVWNLGMLRVIECRQRSLELFG